MKSIIKISFILAVVFIFQNNVNAQLSVSPSGATSINANIADWGSGLRVTVPTGNGCAYHLTYAGHDVFFVCAQGYTWSKVQGYYGASDIRFKENIKKIDSPLSKVLKLSGVSFDYKDAKNPEGQRLGLIAQDVQKIVPGIVKTMQDSSLAISYSDLIPLLIEAVKEQQIQIEALKKVNGNNSGSLKSASEPTLLETTESIALAYLDQNAPNPFSQTTQIGYYLPDAVQKATLYVYDMNGMQLKTIPINQKGKGSITINGSELRPGMYLYTLIADGKEIDTKRMILTE